MNKKWAFIFPGQGAQYIGMAKDFYEQFSIARETFEEADDLLSSSFSRIIFEGPASELVLTKNSQVGIYIASIAIWRTLKQQFPDLEPAVCGGLSLGEYTALTAAQKIGFADCLKLVQKRAQYMNDACEATVGTMSVVLGLEPEAVQKVISELYPSHLVWVANINCPGQVVISGTVSGIEAASIALKERGAKRVLPLDVSGAFHSGLMKSAQEKLSPFIEEVTLLDSNIDLVMNVPGGYVSSIEEMRENLIRQVTSPVLWEKGIRATMDKGVDYYLELGCGKTLVGMNKRIGTTAPSMSIEKVSDLEDFSKLREANYAAIEK